jgi:hypothetical protein
MRSSLAKAFPAFHIASVVVLTLLLSGWDGCTGFVAFTSCPGPAPMAQVMTLRPDAVPGDLNSVPLIVNGSGFTAQSQILWNGSTLETTFIDSRHLQATITQETLDSFGGSRGNNAQIAVRSHGSGSGCPHSDSAALVLVIN